MIIYLISAYFSTDTISHFMNNILEDFLAGKLLLSNTLRINNPIIF